MIYKGINKNVMGENIIKGREINEKWGGGLFLKKIYSCNGERTKLNFCTSISGWPSGYVGRG